MVIQWNILLGDKYELNVYIKAVQSYLQQLRHILYLKKENYNGILKKKKKLTSYAILSFIPSANLIRKKANNNFFGLAFHLYSYLYELIGFITMNELVLEFLNEVIQNNRKTIVNRK